MDYPSDLTDEK